MHVVVEVFYSKYCFELSCSPGSITYITCTDSSSTIPIVCIYSESVNNPSPVRWFSWRTSDCCLWWCCFFLLGDGRTEKKVYLVVSKSSRSKQGA